MGPNFDLMPRGRAGERQSAG